jgi:DNA-binding transcriptional LysR family regulator
LELHQLRCFLAVVEEGGFNRATSRLHISQPALSYQIKRLEQEVGASLFYRRPGGVNPTEAGRVLFQHAQKVIEAVRQAQSAVEELAEGVVGQIRIGTASSVGTYFLPQVLWSMRKKYPKARPSVLYRRSSEVLDLLRSNQLDLALVADPRPDKRLQQETLIEEEVSLVCGQSHPFFGVSSISPAELEGIQFITVSTRSRTGQLIREHLAKLEVHVESVISTDNVETVKKVVEAGLGVAFLPDMVTSEEISCKGESLGKLSRIKVGSPLYRHIVMVTWKHFEMSKATEAFVEELRFQAANWKDCADS